MQAKYNLSQHDVNEFPEKNKGRYMQRMKKDPTGMGCLSVSQLVTFWPKREAFNICSHTTKEEQSRGTVD